MNTQENEQLFIQCLEIVAGANYCTSAEQLSKEAQILFDAAKKAR